MNGEKILQGDSYRLRCFSDYYVSAWPA